MADGRVLHRVVLVLLPLVMMRAAAGDQAEIERRLTSARVDAKTRVEIRSALDRGVAFLVGQQQEDGSFIEPAPTARGPMPRATFVTALAALSLQHVSTPATDEPVQRALRWLFDADAARKAELGAHAGEAGLALALAAGRPGREELARKLVGVLAGAISSSTGWWCGDSPGAYYRWQPPPEGVSYAARDNLVDSQLVVLGLLAARKAGIAVPPEVWKRHAEGLVKTQSARGGWPLAPTEDAADFSCGTYVGLANLLAARAAGADSPTARAATEKARRALARDATYTVTAPRGHFAALEDEEAFSGPVPGSVQLRQMPTPETSTDPGDVAYVRLFSLGRACASADVAAFDVDDQERPGRSKPSGRTKLLWFTRAGRWLLDVQDTSGGWSPGGGAPKGGIASTIDTAYALLFLSRAMDAFHPVRPASVDAKPRAAKPTPSAGMGG